MKNTLIIISIVAASLAGCASSGSPKVEPLKFDQPKLKQMVAEGELTHEQLAQQRASGLPSDEPTQRRILVEAKKQALYNFLRDAGRQAMHGGPR